MKIWLNKKDLDCLNEGEEITIFNEIDIEVNLNLKEGYIENEKISGSYKKEKWNSNKVRLK